MWAIGLQGPGGMGETFWLQTSAQSSSRTHMLPCICLFHTRVGEMNFKNHSEATSYVKVISNSCSLIHPSSNGHFFCTVTDRAAKGPSQQLSLFPDSDPNQCSLCISSSFDSVKWRPDIVRQEGKCWQTLLLVDGGWLWTRRLGYWDRNRNGTSVKGLEHSFLCTHTATEPPMLCGKSPFWAWLGERG